MYGVRHPKYFFCFLSEAQIKTQKNNFVLNPKKNLMERLQWKRWVVV